MKESSWNDRTVSQGRLADLLCKFLLFGFRFSQNLDDMLVLVKLGVCQRGRLAVSDCVDVRTVLQEQFYTLGVLLVSSQLAF